MPPRRRLALNIRRNGRAKRGPAIQISRPAALGLHTREARWQRHDRASSVDVPYLGGTRPCQVTSKVGNECRLVFGTAQSFPLAQLALPKCQSSLGPGVQRRLALCWCGAGLKVQPVRGWKPTSGICSSGWVALQLRDENAVPTAVSPSYSEPRTPPSMRSWPGTGPTSTDQTKGPPSPAIDRAGQPVGGNTGKVGGIKGSKQGLPF